MAMHVRRTEAAGHPQRLVFVVDGPMLLYRLGSVHAAELALCCSYEEAAWVLATYMVSSLVELLKYAREYSDTVFVAMDDFENVAQYKQAEQAARQTSRHAATRVAFEHLVAEAPDAPIHNANAVHADAAEWDVGADADADADLDVDETLARAVRCAMGLISLVQLKRFITDALRAAVRHRNFGDVCAVVTPPHCEAEHFAAGFAVACAALTPPVTVVVVSADTDVLRFPTVQFWLRDLPREGKSVRLCLPRKRSAPQNGRVLAKLRALKETEDRLGFRMLTILVLELNDSERLPDVLHLTKMTSVDIVSDAVRSNGVTTRVAAMPQCIASIVRAVSHRAADEAWRKIQARGGGGNGGAFPSLKDVQLAYTNALAFRLSQRVPIPTTLAEPRRAVTDMTSFALAWQWRMCHPYGLDLGVDNVLRGLVCRDALSQRLGTLEEFVQPHPDAWANSNPALFPTSLFMSSPGRRPLFLSGLDELINVAAAAEAEASGQALPPQAQGAAAVAAAAVDDAEVDGDSGDGSESDGDSAGDGDWVTVDNENADNPVPLSEALMRCREVLNNPANNDALVTAQVRMFLVTKKTGFARNWLRALASRAPVVNQIFGAGNGARIHDGLITTANVMQVAGYLRAQHQERQ